MKKFRLISILLSICLMLCAFGPLNVSAADGDLVFDMDFSGVNPANTNTIGLKAKSGYGESFEIGIGEPNDAVAATKKQFRNFYGDTVDYISFTKQGTDPYAVRIRDDSLANKSFTAEFWMRVKDSTTSTNRVLVAVAGGAEADNYQGNATYIEYYGRPYYNPGTGAKWFDLSDTEWKHVAMVRTISNGTVGYSVYVDGAHIGTKEAAAMTVATEEKASVFLSTMFKNYGNAYTAENLDFASVKIYEGARTATQIANDFSSEKATYSLPWDGVNVTFKDVDEPVLGMEKGGEVKTAANSVYGTGWEGVFDIDTAVTNKGGSYKAYRDANGYLTFDFEGTNYTHSTMEAKMPLPTVYKSGTYTIQLGIYAPNGLTENQLFENVLRFDGTVASKPVMETSYISGHTAIDGIRADGSKSGRKTEKHANDCFYVRAVYSAPSATADWNIKLYNDSQEYGTLIMETTLPRSVVGDLKGSMWRMWASASYGEKYKDTEVKFAYIKVGANPFAIGDIALTDADGGIITEIAGNNTINYDVPVGGSASTVIVAVYDGTELETVKTHNWNGTGNVTGKFENLDVTGEGKIKVFMWGKNFDSLKPRCDFVVK